MENSNQYDGLLIMYLTDELASEERVFVENWINSSEQNKTYFEEVRNVWKLVAEKQVIGQVLEQINTDEKWDRFQQRVIANETKVVTFSHEEERVHKPIVYKLLIAVSVAASVFLVIGFGWKFFFGKGQEVPVAVKTEKASGHIVSVTRHEVNTTGKEKRIQLQDGSLIILENNSEVFFQEPFSDKRDITLAGKAYFKVAKDKTKPFTVLSGEISTTAIGTEFTVISYKTSHRITVQLFEGKVVVKAADKANGKLKHDVYLLPGEEFVYDNQSTGQVRKIKRKNGASEQIIEDEKSRDNLSIPENTESPYFMFNNQRLSRVIDDLAALYNVKIIYNKKDLQNIYFTGKYEKSESLEVILNRIGTLNKLTISKNNDVFIISK